MRPASSSTRTSAAHRCPSRPETRSRSRPARPTWSSTWPPASGPLPAFILKVHPSNFVISGFTSAVGVADLVGLGPPVVVDIGSGLLAPHPLLPDEPDAATVLRAGAALVTASGDKLLGGPQA